MNSLEQFITENDLNECAAMNALQESVVVSDNCARASEVADDENAVAWLKHRATQG